MFKVPTRHDSKFGDFHSNNMSNQFMRRRWRIVFKGSRGRKPFKPTKKLDVFALFNLRYNKSTNVNLKGV